MARSQLTQKKNYTSTMNQSQGFSFVDSRTTLRHPSRCCWGLGPWGTWEILNIRTRQQFEKRGSIQNSERSYASSNKYNKAMSIQRSTALLLITVDSPWSNSSSSDATSSRGRYKLCTPSVLKFLSPLRGCERTAPCQAAERADPSRACWPRACPAPPPAHRSHLHA